MSKQARGTPCYRAPELLDPDPVFSNKVDIFALGCILFELVSWGRKAFESDWHVHEYRTRDQLYLSFCEIDDYWKSRFQDEVYQMLAVDRTDRPSAVKLQQRFSQNRWVSVGHECLERKNYSNLIKMYRLAIEEGVDEPSVFREIGDAYKAIENYTEAAKAYKAAIDGGLEDSKLLAKLGGVYYELAKYDKALVSFESATKKDPDNPSLLMQAGDAYVSNKQYKQAIQKYQKALRKSSSNNAMLLDKLSRAHWLNGDKDKALKINPNLANVLTPPFQRPRSSSPTFGPRQVPSRPDTAIPRVLPSLQTRRRRGSLTIDTNTESTVNPTPTPSPGLTRRAHIRRSKSETPISGLQSPLSLLITPGSGESQTSHVSITAMRQHSTRLDEIIDAHSGNKIVIGSKIAALESYSAQHFDEAFVTYGDVVQVEEIYENGWVLGLKMDYKVWVEREATSEVSESSEDLDEAGFAWQAQWWSSQKYLFELCHFCHSEVWEKVCKHDECTDHVRSKE